VAATGRDEADNVDDVAEGVDEGDWGVREEGGREGTVRDRHEGN
jgi:hypothetical protein